jgi:hypothetical protein
MKFNLTTSELQRLIIALIYAKTEFEQKGDTELAKNTEAMIDLFAKINAKVKWEHDYTATFTVTF